MTREDIYAIAGNFPGAVSDTPFEDDFDTTVLRHRDSGKWFALVFRAPCRKLGIDRDGETDIINLKCDPVISFGLTESYDAVIPAYHMNKYHWISVILERGVPGDVLEMLMNMSYDLTKTKPKKRTRKARTENE